MIQKQAAANMLLWLALLVVVFRCIAGQHAYQAYVVDGHIEFEAYTNANY